MSLPWPISTVLVKMVVLPSELICRIAVEVEGVSTALAALA